MIHKLIINVICIYASWMNHRTDICVSVTAEILLVGITFRIKTEFEKKIMKMLTKTL